MSRPVFNPLNTQNKAYYTINTVIKSVLLVTFTEEDLNRMFFNKKFSLGLIQEGKAECEAAQSEGF